MNIAQSINKPITHTYVEMRDGLTDLHIIPSQGKFGETMSIASCMKAIAGKYQIGIFTDELTFPVPIDPVKLLQKLLNHHY